MSDVDQNTEKDPLTCPGCGADLSLTVLYETGGVCPSCSAELVLGEENVSLPESDRDEADLDALEGIDLELVRDIAALSREGYWQARVVSRMIESYCRELRVFIDDLHAPAANHGWFRSVKHFKDGIDDAVEGFMMALVGCQDVLRKELGMAMGASDLTGTRIFYDQFGDELHQLERFYAKGADLSLPADPVYQELQAVMIGWGPFIADQLEFLATELSSTADDEAEDLWQASVQITLAPVTLTRFYELYERLK